jgi:hypothetical protein
MRKGLLIYEEMSNYLVKGDEAVSHLWLWNRSLLNFLINEENLIFFFISVGYAETAEETYIGWGPMFLLFFLHEVWVIFLPMSLLNRLMGSRSSSSLSWNVLSKYSISISYSFFSCVAGRACHLQTDWRGGGSGLREPISFSIFLFHSLYMYHADLSPISSCSCSNLYDDPFINDL